MPFGLITPEMLAAYWAAQGITPPEPASTEPPEPIVCEVCETELDEWPAQVEGMSGEGIRYFHTECLTMYIIQHEDDNDPLVAHITRVIPCSTAQ